MITIANFQPQDAQAFYDINMQWIKELFSVEPIDDHILKHPQEQIIDTGGHIFMAFLDDQPVGSGALKQTGPHSFELTKMGVIPQAQGHKIGSQLLKALIAKAKELHAKKLYLLSSHKCAAAVHLYESFGFVHDEEVMVTYGSSYDRCDVAMSYPL